jgi:choline kinase
MKAIIISAGQGRRLLPLTSDTPKCLLPVIDGRSILEVQLQTLAACGVTDVSIMVGFGADQVEDALRYNSPAGMTTRACYNPFYASSDNLITVWLARSEMRSEFLLLNGDTLFETAVLSRLLDSAERPLTLAINAKDEYDDDDMKVSLDSEGRLRAVGKTLEPSVVDGESIGLMLFRSEGSKAFRAALDQAVRNPESAHSWYLSVINNMTEHLRIATTPIRGLWWGEVDSHEDLVSVRDDLERLTKLNGNRIQLSSPNTRLRYSEGAPS